MEPYTNARWNMRRERLPSNWWSCLSLCMTDVSSTTFSQVSPSPGKSALVNVISQKYSSWTRYAMKAGYAICTISECRKTTTGSWWSATDAASKNGGSDRPKRWLSTFLSIAISSRRSSTLWKYALKEVNTLSFSTYCKFTHEPPFQINLRSIISIWSWTTSS